MTEGAAAKASAVDHLTNPVRWTDEERVLTDMIAADKDNEWVILEVGPGKVLSGLWGQTELGATVPCTPVNTAEAIGAL